LGLWDKLRLAATIMYAARIKDGRPLERILATDWLRRWSGERTLQRMWLPLLRAKLGAHHTEASASFIWAIIARMYAARRTGLKKEVFGYVRGGYARILDRFTEFLEQQEVRLCPGRIVTRVEPEGDRVRIETRDSPPETFDRVVLTLACPLIARVCPDLSAAERDRLLSIQYQGVICASVLLPEPLAGYYVTNIVDEGVPYTAVIEMTAFVDRIHFGGRSLVFLPRYATQDDPSWDWPDDRLRNVFLAGFERMYPGRSQQVQAFQVSRVRHVLAVPTLNYSE